MSAGRKKRKHQAQRSKSQKSSKRAVSVRSPRHAAPRTELGSHAIKYVYLDVVEFSKGRVIEAQAAIIEALSQIVHRALEHRRIDEDTVILMPAGDGVCIALIEATKEDVHLNLAIEILSLLQAHNLVQDDPSRKFEVRVGLNSNRDNIVRHVNNELSVAGRGVNEAQRIMSLADPGQILIGAVDYEELRGRQKYHDWFKAHDVILKHDVRSVVYHVQKGPDLLSKSDPVRIAGIASEFTRRAVDATYLQQFESALLKRIENAVRRAGFAPLNNEEFNSLLDEIDRVRNVEPFWRRGYSVRMEHSPHERIADACCLRLEFRWMYVNFTGAARSVSQVLWHNPGVVPQGVEAKERVRLLELFIDGVDRKNYADEVEQQFGSTGASWPIQVPVPQTGPNAPGVELRYTVELVQHKHEPYQITFFGPVHGLEVDLEYSENIVPELYIFAVEENKHDLTSKSGQPVVTNRAGVKRIRWNHEGWFLQDQGAVLNFRESMASAGA